MSPHLASCAEAASILLLPHRHRKGSNDEQQPGPLPQIRILTRDQWKTAVRALQPPAVPSSLPLASKCHKHFLPGKAVVKPLKRCQLPFLLLLVKEPPAGGTGSSPGIAALGGSRDELP